MTAPTLGLTMIVKNGGETLRACLESARDVASEMIVADTGSTTTAARLPRNAALQ
jgi:hypothetical protein